MKVLLENGRWKVDVLVFSARLDQLVMIVADMENAGQGYSTGGA